MDYKADEDDFSIIDTKYQKDIKDRETIKL